MPAKNANDPILQDPLRLFALANLVARAKEFGENFIKVEDFANFVKDPTTSIGALASQSGTLNGSAASSAVSTGAVGAITNGQKLGLELDLTKLKQIASASPRRTFRVEAWGEIDR